MDDGCVLSDKVPVQIGACRDFRDGFMLRLAFVRTKKTGTPSVHNAPKRKQNRILWIGCSVTMTNVESAQ